MEKFISGHRQVRKGRSVSKVKTPKTATDQDQPPFCTGSQGTKQPSEGRRRSSGALPELLLVKKKFLGKMENLSSMHSINPSEAAPEFSIRNHYYPDETKLTIFSEDRQPKHVTQRMEAMMSRPVSAPNLSRAAPVVEQLQLQNEARQGEARTGVSAVRVRRQAGDRTGPEQADEGRLASLERDSTTRGAQGEERVLDE